MKSTTKIVEWEAEDGRKFDNRLECEVYEKGQAAIEAAGLKGTVRGDRLLQGGDDLLAKLRKYLAAKARLDASKAESETPETPAGEDTAGGARADAHTD